MPRLRRWLAPLGLALLLLPLLPSGPVHASSGTVEQQLAKDKMPIPPGLGAVFVPRITGPDHQEPPYTVYDTRGRKVAVATTGRKAFVVPGTYVVRIGTGNRQRLPSYRITVKKGKVVVLKPRWAGLLIRVVDDKLVTYRGAYDIIHLGSRKGVGSGIGADEQLGEKVRAWLLPPGHYMIVKEGDSYLARTNYFTVQLDEGKVTHFRLVVDRNSGTFLGGGVQLERDVVAKGPWDRMLQLSGSLLFSRRDNVESAEAGNSFSSTAYIYGRLSLNLPKHYFINTLNLELGLTVSEGSGLRKSADALDFDSTYIFRMTRAFGLYVRLGADSTLLSSVKYFSKSDPIQAEGGMIYRSYAPGDLKTEQVAAGQLVQVRLSGAMDPLRLEEGIGVNLEAIRSLRINLSIRFGFGFRQTIARDVYSLRQAEVRCKDPGKRSADNPLDTTNCPASADQERHVGVMLEKKKSSHREGLELLIVGQGSFTRHISMRTEFKVLGPFVDFGQAEVNWETTLTVRLSHYVSLNYRVKIGRDPEASGESSLGKWSVDQSALLSFSLLLR